MKTKELRDLPVEELKAKAVDLEKELFNLRMRHATAQLENPLKIRGARKDVARAKTIIAEKERNS